MDSWFCYDERLGLALPSINVEWETLPAEERSQILYAWEQIRGTIPQLITNLEVQIIAKQNELDHEDNFLLSCRLNSEIARIASQINDLHLWFRVHQEIDMTSRHD